MLGDERMRMLWRSYARGYRSLRALSGNNQERKQKGGDVRLVNIESPYSGKDKFEIQENTEYARACVKDCLSRGEAPIASHLLYTQPGVLDDKNPDERMLGMQAGFAWNKKAEATIVYTDLGITRGMTKGIERAVVDNRKIEFRKLPEKKINLSDCLDCEDNDKTLSDYPCNQCDAPIKLKDK